VDYYTVTQFAALGSCMPNSSNLMTWYSRIRIGFTDIGVPEQEKAPYKRLN